MNNLIKTEWLKIKKYRAFWWMTAIVAFSYPGINYLVYQGYDNRKNSGETLGQLLKMLDNPFTFPEVWHTVAYFSSFFIFIPAIAVIMFITNEYTYKTHRQNIIDGWSRNEFMTAKMMDVVIISLLVTLTYVLISIVIGSLNMDESTGNMWSKGNYIALFFLQTFAQLSIAFLLAFLIRKAFIALGVFMFYFLAEMITVAILNNKDLDHISRFLPMEVSDKIIPPPAFTSRMGESSDWYTKALEDVNPHVVYTLILTGLIWALCFRVNRKKDF